MARAIEFIGLGDLDVGLTAASQPSRSEVPVPGSFLEQLPAAGRAVTLN